ncbi:MAG: tRNA(Glu)-specific nuclease WapA [Verrucomicrobiales bacterium]|nr:tRNA(Glu)-specific nuclease WapA [Verrucomicrobiales bacterium]
MGGAILDQQAYLYDIGNERFRQTRTDGGYVDYLYDNIGEVYSAKTYTSGRSPVAAENFGYLYDPAFNLNKKTNNVTVTSSTLNNLNEVTATTPSTYTYASIFAMACPSHRLHPGWVRTCSESVGWPESRACDQR